MNLRVTAERSTGLDQRACGSIPGPPISHRVDPARPREVIKRDSKLAAWSCTNEAVAHTRHWQGDFADLQHSVVPPSSSHHESHQCT